MIAQGFELIRPGNIIVNATAQSLMVNNSNGTRIRSATLFAPTSGEISLAYELLPAFPGAFIEFLGVRNGAVFNYIGPPILIRAGWPIWYRGTAGGRIFLTIDGM